MKNGRTLKRVLSLLLCVLMFASLLPGFAFADLETPQLTGAAPDGSAVLVTWNAVSGAAAYRVYRKTSSTDWVKLADTAGNSYRDTSAAAGTTYIYTVRCLDSSNTVVSDYNHSGVSGKWTKADAGWLATPPLKGTSVEGNAIRVKWNEVAGALGYRIYRKTSSTNWAFLADVGAVGDYLDSSVTVNVTYYYTVRALNASNEVVSDYVTSGVSGKVDSSSPQLATPELVSAGAEGTGILVSWNAVTGAAGYKVYRKTASTDWTSLGTTSATTYKDNSAAEGTTYTYTVRCLDSSNVVCSDYNRLGVSGAWTKATAGFIATPKLVSAKVDGTAIAVKWNAVSGAASYRVYRKAGNGSWQFQADTAAVEYLDTTVSANVKYTYTVRCLDGSSVVCSDYDKAGVSATVSASAMSQLETPKLLGASAEGSGLRVSWNAVSGAAAYRIYRKSGNGGWQFLANVNGGSTTSYLDNATTAGVRYTYTVRCLNNSNNVCSDYDRTGVSGSWSANNTGALTTPVLVSVLPKETGVLFSWNLVPGADGYRIYRKTENGGWVKVADVTGTEDSYLDTNVQNNTQYTYTVRCLSSGAVSSGYDTAGKTLRFFFAPSNLQAENSDSGILVSWSAVPGARRYLVYRKIGMSGVWGELAIVTGTSYQDNTANPGTEYYYTVRVIPASTKTPYLSDFVHPGISATYVGRAEISTLTNTVDGVEIKWKSIAGIAKYNIYRKSGNGGFNQIGQTTGTTYLDSSAVSNTSYTYMIRGLDSSDEFFGSYDAEGKTITFYAAPKLVDAVREKNGIRVSWEQVEGLTYYAVYRKIGSGNWIELYKPVAGTNYLDTTIVSGVDATYTVCGISADGKTKLSAYDSTGITCHSQTFYAAPVLVSVSTDIGGIKVVWNEVDGVSNYRVFRKDNTATSWTDIQDVSGTEYLDPDLAHSGTVKNGGTYTYTVACLDASNQLASEYNTTGLSATYYTVPEMVSAENAVSGVKITWNAADGIGTYAVYRKTGSDSWQRIASGVGGTAYLDSSAQSAGHYFYAVASMINGVEVSAYAKPGVETTFFAPPHMVSASNVETGVKVTWEPIDGVSMYRLYKDTNGGGWTYVTDVTDTSYVDTSVASNNTYRYTARCYDGTDVISDYERSGVSVRYIAAPTLVSATGGDKRITVVWSAVDGAVQYRVYRKTATTDWAYLATVTGGGTTTYTNTGLNSGYVYYYTVVAIDSNNNRSSYNNAGISATTN